MTIPRLRISSFLISFNLAHPQARRCHELLSHIYVVAAVIVLGDDEIIIGSGWFAETSTETTNTCNVCTIRVEWGKILGWLLCLKFLQFTSPSTLSPADLPAH